MMARTRDGGRLTSSLKAGYGVGGVIDGSSTTALTYFALFYFTAVCGLSGSLAGLAVFIGLLVDSSVDPLIGLVSDNTRSRFGRRHVYMLTGILPLAVAFGLLFSVPGWGGTPLFAYVVVLSVVTRVLLSVFNLPYYALGAELTDDYAERMNVVGYRIAFVMAANCLCLGIGLGGFFSGPHGLLDRPSYARFGWTGAGVMLVAGLTSLAATRRVLETLHSAEASTETLLVRLRREFREISRNPSFMPLFIGSIAFCVAQGTSGALTLYANRYLFGLTERAIQPVVLSIPLGAIFGIPLTALAARQFEKRSIAIAAIMLLAVCFALTPLLRITDVLPPTGPALVAILIGNGLVVGTALTSIGISVQAMIADASDEHEYLYGVRREGLFFAGLTLAVKAATGLGAMIAGVVLDAIRFPVARIAAHQPYSLGPIVLRDLGVVVGVLPALLALVAPVMLLRYRLNAVTVRDIQRALRERAGTRAKRA